jgi:tetratricopeptide (TPR) repeat protein
VPTARSLPTSTSFAATRPQPGTLWEASRYVELGGELPDLMARAKTAARALSGDEQRAAWALLANVYNITSATLHKVDEHELAWIASDRAMAAAERAESLPLIGASTWWLAHVFLRSGRIEEATDLLKTGIDALEPDLGHAGPAHLSVWGAMLLTSAITAAKRNDRTDAWAYVREARKAADQLGHDGNYLATAFGPTNVALRTVAVPVELGDAGEALQVARTIDPSPLAPNLLERRAMFHIDVARAYGQRRNDAAAVATLLEAERIAPRRSTTTWSCASCSGSSSSVSAGPPPRGCAHSPNESECSSTDAVCLARAGERPSRREPRSPTTPRVEGSGRPVLACREPQPQAPHQPTRLPEPGISRQS